MTTRFSIDDEAHKNTAPVSWQYLDAFHREMRWADWIHLLSRRVVGWMLDSRMEAALVNEDLNHVLGHSQVVPEHLLLDTDQRSHYQATDYRDLLWEHKIACSMYAKGCCWDTAVVESLSSTLKLELNLDDNKEVLISRP